ncbi:MAG: CAP domain-containing protein [Pseudoruegeria sp.]
MIRILSFVFVTLFALAACEPTYTQSPTATGQGGPTVYNISSRDAGLIPGRMLDGVNALRASAGAQPLRLNSQLTSAAASHSRDMSAQNRPWHFGSNGSSPLDRIRQSGYPGIPLGELISETYETELQTLAAWMEDPSSRSVILDPAAINMGISWVQDKNGKLWWTLVTGG